MSSVKREYALPAPGIQTVVLTDGDGSNSTTNVAKAFLDMRTNSIFSIDISELTGYKSWPYIQFDTYAGSPGHLPGKVITVLFTGKSDVDGIKFYFTSNFGQNIYTVSQNDNIYTYGSFGQPFSMRLISDGTDFIATPVYS